MKIIKCFLIGALLISISVGGVYFYYDSKGGTLPTFINRHTTNKKYIIKKAGRIIDSAATIDEAITKAKDNKRSIAINTINNDWVYSEFHPFLIITDTAVHDFNSFKEAVNYARDNKYDKIYFKNDSTLIWEDNVEIESTSSIDIPLINQMPELPRGCEVTSLAMILNYRKKDVSKLELAQKVKKDTTAYYVDENGKKHYGNPYDGFVGDMYNIKKNGYGVYHGPIVDLAKEYCDQKVIDLSGLNSSDILYFVANGNPVWVITNTLYKPLDDTYFEMWHTPTGIVKVTYKLHSVVITGFDEKNIYINDPLQVIPNRAVNKELFIKSWEQMGNQAMTILE